MTTQPSSGLWEAITRINATLEAGEPGNVTADRNYKGYRSQALFDAINEHIGPENWTYIVHSVTPLDNDPVAYEAVVTVIFRVDGQWNVDEANRRLQYGGGRGDRDRTDGKKAAITDGIKKCLSSYSIGNRAFLQLLGTSPQESHAPSPNRRTTNPPPTSRATGPREPLPAPPPEAPLPPPPPSTLVQGGTITLAQRKTLNDRFKTLTGPSGKPYFTKDTYEQFLFQNFEKRSIMELDTDEYPPCMLMLDSLETRIRNGGTA